MRSANTGRAKIDRIRLGLRHVDELLQIIGAKRDGYGNDAWGRGHKTYWSQILEWV